MTDETLIRVFIALGCLLFGGIAGLFAGVALVKAFMDGDVKPKDWHDPHDFVG